MATGIPKASKMPFVTPVSSSAVSWLMKKSRYQVIARLSNVVLLLGVLRVSRRLLTRMLARSMSLYGASPTVVTPVLYVWMACSSCLKAGGSRRISSLFRTSVQVILKYLPRGSLNFDSLPSNSHVQIHFPIL